MEGWIRIYAGHDPQVEQDRQQLEDAGVPAQIIESPREVVNSPFEQHALPAAELHVRAEHEERTREILDLPLDYDAPQHSTPRWVRLLSIVGWIAGVLLCGYSVVVSRGATPLSAR